MIVFSIVARCIALFFTTFIMIGLVNSWVKTHKQRIRTQDQEEKVMWAWSELAILFAIPIVITMFHWFMVMI